MIPATIGASFRRALRDIAEGLAFWRLWSLLGWKDIRQRYRRTVLGPFWLTANMGIFIGAIGLLYSRLLKVDIDSYVPFLTAGFIVWTTVFNFLIDSCKTFVIAENAIKQRRLPLSLFVFRTIWRHLLIMAHNLVIFVAVAVLLVVTPSPATLLLIPAFALACVNAAWLGLALAMLSARFRDVEQFIAALLQVAFFVTPIFWTPDLLGDRMVFVEINPLYHFIELIRAPLLGLAPRAVTWSVTGGTAVVGWFFTLWLYGHYRGRIPYWL